MPRKTYNCINYGHTLYKDIILYCIDCEEMTYQQLAYYKGSQFEKVHFCMQCGKIYCYDWED